MSLPLVYGRKSTPCRLPLSFLISSLLQIMAYHFPILSRNLCIFGPQLQVGGVHYYSTLHVWGSIISTIIIYN